MSDTVAAEGDESRAATLAAFAPGEYARRLARVRERMQALGIDVLLVTDPANMNYVSGYDAWSFYVHQAVIVPPEWLPSKLIVEFSNTAVPRPKM